MTETMTQLKARLDQLEDKLRRARGRGELSAAHRAEAESIGARAETLRTKIASIHESAFENMKRDLHRDWEILSHAFERWEREVDARFRGN